jgi:hypothetical protein
MMLQQADKHFMALTTNVLNYVEQDLFQPKCLSDMLEQSIRKGVSGQ